MFSESRQNPIRDSLRDRNKYKKSSNYSPKSKYKPGFTSDKYKIDYKGISRANKFNCDSFKTKYDVYLSRRGKSKIPKNNNYFKETWTCWKRKENLWRGNEIVKIKNRRREKGPKPKK